jgi:5-methylcytosine-specific restriction endonuclease McrA
MTIEEILFLETDDSCAYCGLHQKENLSIHHVDGDKTNNEYENLIVLCHCCHHRVTNNKGISKEDIKKRKKTDL